MSEMKVFELIDWFMINYFWNIYGCIVICLCEKYMFRIFKIFVFVNINIKKVYVFYVVYFLFYLYKVEVVDDEFVDMDEFGVGFKKIGIVIGEWFEFKVFCVLIII